MQVEKFHWKTEEAFNHIRQGKPVVLIDCPLVCPAHTAWTVDGIAQMMKSDFPCDVQVSETKRFQYFDTSKNAYHYEFTPPMRKVAMPFQAFLRAMRSQGEGADCKAFHYLQQSLVAEMGTPILEEYSKFSLQTAALYKVLAGWNAMTHNLLLVGAEGYVTPMHFDEQENIFTQLYGRKRVRLAPPSCWPHLYTFPSGHPCDRQSQVTLPQEPGQAELDMAQRLRFPAFAGMAAHELYADLEAGEVLYIPQYWFHQMEGLTENVSLSWWFKHIIKREGTDPSNIRLDDVGLVAVRRNIGEHPLPSPACSCSQ